MTTETTTQLPIRARVFATLDEFYAATCAHRTLVCQFYEDALMDDEGSDPELRAALASVLADVDQLLAVVHIFARQLRPEEEWC